MIVYSNTKGGFVDDVRNGIIAKKITEEFNKHNVKHHNDAEYRAWFNSLVHCVMLLMILKYRMNAVWQLNIKFLLLQKE